MTDPNDIVERLRKPGMATREECIDEIERLRAEIEALRAQIARMPMAPPVEITAATQGNWGNNFNPQVYVDGVGWHILPLWVRLDTQESE